ncbi:MAG: SWIM zinc finger family protein [Chloroflexi bacterium]|nr:SWIM zinc finger family protein [Chloroflexota bacterium]
MINRYGPYKRYAQVFGVTSHSTPSKEYTVAISDKGVWSCSCPAWIFHSPRRNCKHIEEAVKAQAVQVAVKVITPKIEKALNRFAAIEV